MSNQTEFTKVTGFFNPNEYSIALHSSKLGFNNFVVQGKHFVEDPNHRRYNDPLLEAFVGPQQLAREVSDTPVPVYHLPVQNNTPPSVGSPGFTSSRTIPASMRPVDPVANAAAAKAKQKLAAPTKVMSTRTATIMERPATPQSPVTSSNPVMGMSMAEARRKGLVAGTVTPAPEGIPDDDGREVAKAAPTIGIARDGGRRNQPPIVAQPVPAAPQPPKGSIAATLAESAQIDVDAEDPIAEQMRVMGSLESEPEVQRAPASPVFEPPAPRVQPVAVPPRQVPQMSSLAKADLPEPKLAEVPIKSRANPKETKRFVCAADGKAFNWRWELKKHVVANYPGKEDELLANYPPSSQEMARNKS